MSENNVSTAQNRLFLEDLDCAGRNTSCMFLPFGGTKTRFFDLSVSPVAKAVKSCIVAPGVSKSVKNGAKIGNRPFDEFNRWYCTPFWVCNFF